MCSAMRLREHNTVTEIRVLADQAFSRAAGAPLVALLYRSYTLYREGQRKRDTRSSHRKSKG